MIRINEEKEFHLQTKNSSYIMKVLPTGHLANLYYGKKIKHRNDFSTLYQNYNIEVGNSTTYSEESGHFTLDTTRLEVATYGKGDYREPSMHLNFADNSRVSDFLYQDYNIIEGMVGFDNLPEIEISGENNLEIILVDKIKNVELHLFYKVFEDYDIISRSLKLINKGENELKIEKLMSFNLDLVQRDFDIYSLDGKWIKERRLNKHKFDKGTFYIDSKKGVSSSDHNPFLALKDRERNEVYGFTLVYSGNHQALVEKSPHDFSRIQMGINPFDFNWLLKEEESFQSPEMMMAFFDKGFMKMSQNFHDIINNRLIAKKWRKKPRPILFNNWEATYFDFDEKKLLKLARQARDLGIELFVLDDGWFGKRNDDSSSLGDWYVNREKLPSGIKGLSEKINNLGLDFGIWVEPEMVSIDSELYSKHPEWAVKLNDRKASLGRNQLILDLSNPEVVEYLYNQLSSLFEKANISYVKWDMNRNFSDIYSNYLPQERQMEFSHRYYLGLYELLERLTSQFPDILFESCASGGNRFDPAMLYYMPQTWTSDNTDAVERLSIQGGTSYVYPLSTMGAHVSTTPNHQVLRRTPLETRFNVAAFGLLGYELDLNKLSRFEKKVIKKQIEFYKKHRKLLQFGKFYRLKSPFNSNQTIWLVVSEDKNEALMGYYQKLQQSNPPLENIRLKGLDPNKFYKLENRTQYLNIKEFGDLVNDRLPINIKDGGILQSLIANNYLFEQEKENITAYGDELMNAGFRPYNQFIGTGYNEKIRYIGDFGSRLYYLEALN